MKLSFKEASNRISQKYPHIRLLSYNGYKNESHFLDEKYGEFYGKFCYVLDGSKNHKNRANDNSRQLINSAREKLQNRFPYLNLLTYNGSKNEATFFDKKYGEFKANYKSVFAGKKNHPERTKDRKRKARNSEKVKERIRETNLKKYGVSNPSKNKTVASKRKETFLKKYGVENPFQAEEVVCKIKQLYLEKYGVDHFSKTDEFKDKFTDTCLNKYGVKYPLQNHSIMDKAKATNIKKYGVENVFQNNEIKNKIKNKLINNGSYHNIDGYSASEYFRLNNINSSLCTFIKNIDIVGVEEAIKFETNKSNIENIISSLLNGSNINYIFNNKLAGSNIRPDFLIENSKIIIECDGMYYHSDGGGSSDKIKNNKAFHKERQILYKKLGYRSLFFREDEILNKTSIVESIILAKLGLITNKVFARKTNVIELDSKNAAQFFKDNHLMGKGSGKCYALSYNDEVVSAIRIVNKKNYIEVSRFCSKLNTNVVGGLGKLLKHVIKNIDKKKIISFVDMRYGDGHSLLKLGFKEGTNHLSFKWTDFKSTYHRMNFRGNSGYKCGMYKIWDCGQKKFELHLV